MIFKEIPKKNGQINFQESSIFFGFKEKSMYFCKKIY